MENKIKQALIVATSGIFTEKWYNDLTEKIETSLNTGGSVVDKQFIISKIKERLREKGEGFDYASIEASATNYHKHCFPNIPLKYVRKYLNEFCDSKSLEIKRYRMPFELSGFYVGQTFTFIL